MPSRYARNARTMGVIWRFRRAFAKIFPADNGGSGKNLSMAPFVCGGHIHGKQRKRNLRRRQSLARLVRHLLRGGLPLDGITELAGRSSAGKTQLALQLCLAVQLPRHHGGLGAGECRAGGPDLLAPGGRFPSLHTQMDPLPAERRARGLPAGTGWPGLPVNGRPLQGPGPWPP